MDAKWFSFMFHSFLYHLMKRLSSSVKINELLEE